MKIEGGLLVSLSSELALYFKAHPEDLPPVIDVNSLAINCSSYLIEHIENYTAKPFTDKFLWRLKFSNSKNPDYEYMYFITYKAVYKGASEITSAKLIYEKQEIPARWYLSN